jgi:hypothetical protein
MPWLLAAALLLAAPEARAALELQRSDPAPAGAWHLLPELTLDGHGALDLQLARDGGRGGGPRIEPALCLVLGIIPGFGVGHLLARSHNWPVWLVVDVVIAVVFWGPYWYWPGHPGYFPALNLLVLVERLVEGFSAYQAAGGGRIFPLDRGLAAAPGHALQVALPEGYRPGVRF